MKKWLAAALAFLLLLLPVAGCGNNGETPNEHTGDSEQALKPVTVSLYVDSRKTEDRGTQKLIEEFNKNPYGIKVKFNVVAGEQVDLEKQLDIKLLSGDTTNIIMDTNEIAYHKYASLGVLEPLDDLIAEDGYDAENLFYDFEETMRMPDGKVYGLPFARALWMVFYNKDLFDEAGLPYPKGEWTWDEYIETAKRLTDPERGIYGSVMPQYDNVIYIKAKQLFNLSGYKEDGTSDYDNPAFQEAMEWYHGLSETEGIQRGWMENKIKKLDVVDFNDGKYGMAFIESWFFNYVGNLEKNPRSFRIGVTQMPSFGSAAENYNSTVMSTFSINRNSENKKEAFAFIKFAAENYANYRGLVPAFESLKTKEGSQAVAENLSAKTNGELSCDEIQDAFFLPKFQYTPEKITGLVPGQYSTVIQEEAEKYFSGAQSAGEACANIKRRVDQEIAEERKMQGE